MVVGGLAGGKILANLPFLIFFALATGGGGYLALTNWNKIKEAKYQLQEKKRLQLIKRLGGRVSAIEVAAETNMTAEIADDCLRKLCINGYGEEQLAANDSVVYVFDGFLSEDERKGSNSLLDA